MSCFKKNNKDKKSTEPVGEFSDVASKPEVDKGSNFLKRYFYPNCLGNSSILSGAVNLVSNLKARFAQIIAKKDELQLSAEEGKSCPSCAPDKIAYYATADGISAGCCTSLGVTCSEGSSCPDGYYAVESYTCDTYAEVYTVYKCCESACD